MQYCPPNSSLSVPWVNHGFGICFFDTVLYAVLGGLSLLLGTGQIYFYWKHANRHTEGSTQAITPHLYDVEIMFFVVVLPRKFLFRLQLLCHLGLLSLSLVTPVVRHTVSMESAPMLGFEVLELLAGALTWSMCLVLIMVKENGFVDSRDRSLFSCRLSATSSCRALLATATAPSWPCSGSWPSSAPT